MNRRVASEIAEETLSTVMKKSQQEIKDLFDNAEHEFINKYGTEYQVRVSAFYDDRENKIIRVIVTVDDQKFWSTLMPLSRSDLYYEKNKNR